MICKCSVTMEAEGQPIHRHEWTHDGTPLQIARQCGETAERLAAGLGAGEVRLIVQIGDYAGQRSGFPWDGSPLKANQEAANLAVTALRLVPFEVAPPEAPVYPGFSKCGLTRLQWEAKQNGAPSPEPVPEPIPEIKAEPADEAEVPEFESDPPPVKPAAAVKPAHQGRVNKTAKRGR